MKRSLFATIAVVLCIMLLVGCTVKVTPAPSPSPTEAPVITPAPTAEATPEPTPAPTEAPVPTAEPVPEETPEPTAEPSAEPAEEPIPEETPEPVKQPFSESFQTWSDEVKNASGAVVGTAEIRYPVYEGPQSDPLNRLVEWEVSARKKDASVTLNSAITDSELSEGYWFVPYEESQEWVSFRWEDYLILCQTDFTYLGGAHGIYGSTYYVTEFKTGKQVFLSEFLREYGTDLESVGETLVGLCYEMEAAGDIMNVDEAYIRESLIQDGCWYPDEDGIHFIAGVYALAPYASGEIDVTVGWGLLEYIQPVDSGLYSRFNPDADGALIDVLCRDYTPDSTMELPVIVGDEGIAAQAINDEIALLARKYFTSMEGYPEAEEWDRYETLICYPYTAGRYLNIIVTDLLETKYADYHEMDCWVYDKELGRRVTLTDALLLSGCHYDTFEELLSGAFSQCTSYNLQDVAFRMLPGGKPDFFFLVNWTFEEDGFYHASSTYMHMTEDGRLYPCEEWLIDPMELDMNFTSGSLSCQWPGVYAGYSGEEDFG